MAIRITCPGCETSLTLGDDKRGKKVRCKSCEKVLSIPSANGKARTKQAGPDEDEDEEETEDQAAEQEPKKKAKPADEKSETKKDEKSRKKKKKKQGGGIEIPWFWIGLGAVALLILLIPGVAVLLWLPWEEEVRVAKGGGAPAPAPNMMQPPPGGNNPIGGNVVKNPKTLIGQIRARPEQVKRDAILTGFVALYNAYCDEIKNPGARNLDGFLVSIKSESAELVNAVKNKDFIINFKARVESDDILAFEPEMYTQGYCWIRANKAIEYGNAEQLKAAGLEVPAAPAGP